jgi:hypothetical protein
MFVSFCACILDVCSCMVTYWSQTAVSPLLTTAAEQSFLLSATVRAKRCKLFGEVQTSLQ